MVLETWDKLTTWSRKSMAGWRSVTSDRDRQATTLGKPVMKEPPEVEQLGRDLLGLH